MKSLTQHINENLIFESSKPKGTILTVITYDNRENYYTKEDVEEQLKNFDYSADNLVGWLNREGIMKTNPRTFPKNHDKIKEILKNILNHKNSIINVDSNIQGYLRYIKIQ